MVAVKDTTVGMAIVSCATEIVDKGYYRGGIDNKLCREECMGEAHATVRELGISKADFVKEVMNQVRS